MITGVISPGHCWMRDMRGPDCRETPPRGRPESWREARRSASVHLEITVLQGYYPRLVPVFVAQVKEDESRNHQVAGDEVEPGKDRGLEYADVGAEQHHQEEDHGEPWAVGVELRLEFQIVEAPALCDPRLAEAQVADRDAQPNQETAQARGIVENLIDLLVTHQGGKEGEGTDQARGQERGHGHAAPVELAEQLRRLAAMGHRIQHS